MNIRLFPPQSIHEIGKRDNQEDALYPELGRATENDRVFVLCDGMGGHEHGEVASQTVCLAISTYMDYHWPSNDQVTDQLVLDAISYAFEALDEKDDGATKRMGTTLTLVVLHSGGCTAAHIGDSRIYHIRPSEHKVLYRSRDHSLVFDLFQAGEISYEEMSTSPQKNIITKAMQPGENNRVRPDIVHIGNLQPGDYLYMCSDGMLEQMDDNRLSAILCSEKSDLDKRRILIEETTNNNDNHSAHLIHIREAKVNDGETIVDDESTTRYNVINILPETMDAIEIEEEPLEDKEPDSFSNSKIKTNCTWLYLMAAVIVLFFILAWISLSKGDGESQEKQSDPQTEIEIKPIVHEHE